MCSVVNNAYMLTDTAIEISSWYIIECCYCTVRRTCIQTAKTVDSTGCAPIYTEIAGHPLLFCDLH